MGVIATLLPNAGHLQRLRTAIRDRHHVVACEEWAALLRVCEREPVRVAEMVRRLELRLAEQKRGEFRFADEPAPQRGAGFESLDEETRKNLETLGYVK